MEVEPSNFQEGLQGEMGSRHGPICVSNISSSSSIHVLENRPLQQRERCISGGMVPVSGICVFTVLFIRKGSEKDRSGESNDDVSGSSLANSNMVSAAFSNVNNGSYSNSIVPRSLTGSRGKKSPSSSKPEVTTGGLDSFRSRLETEGISKQASSLIAASRRKGTISHYESAWRKWSSWCSREQVDPFSAPLGKILDFLASLFQEGLQYSTTAGYRSALSAYHDPIDGISVGQHPRVSALLTGVYNQRFPKPKNSFIWDVELVC